MFSKTKDQRAKHYRKYYSAPSLPPIWIFKEFLTFGGSARFYDALVDQHQNDIAVHFGVPKLAVFRSWVQNFVDLRNICAHHDRLFNRRFQKQPKKYKTVDIPFADPSTLKAQLECLNYVLNSAGLKSSVVKDIEKILNRYPDVINADAGF